MMMKLGFGVRESIAVSDLAIMVLKRIVNTSENSRLPTTDEQVKSRATNFQLCASIPRVVFFPMDSAILS